MATKKQGGKATSFRDSNPQYLGTKLYDGQKALAGNIIVRQRGTNIMAGKNVGTGKDHTLFALKEGIIKFSTKRKMNFDGTSTKRSAVNVLPIESK